MLSAAAWAGAVVAGVRLQHDNTLPAVVTQQASSHGHEHSPASREAEQSTNSEPDALRFYGSLAVAVLSSGATVEMVRRSHEI